MFTAWMLGLPLDVFYQLQQVALDLPNSRACETEGNILVPIQLLLSYVLTFIGCCYLNILLFESRSSPELGWQFPWIPSPPSTSLR